jgi:hypothetical protein
LMDAAVFGCWGCFCFHGNLRFRRI